MTRFGDKVLADSFYVWDLNNQRFNVTHMIDSLTEYHIGVVSMQANAETTAELLQARWCAVFGPLNSFRLTVAKSLKMLWRRSLSFWTSGMRWCHHQPSGVRAKWRGMVP